MERANEAFKAEVSQLKFEIATLSKSNAEADEKISEANIKVADLESQLTSAKEVRANGDDISSIWSPGLLVVIVSLDMV